MSVPIPKTYDPFTFQQVQEPLDLFIVHAAYACVLHPGCDKGASLPGRGSLGWWNGGNSEEASQAPNKYLGEVNMCVRIFRIYTPSLSYSLLTDPVS